jgi:hypothetical protein
VLASEAISYTHDDFRVARNLGHYTLEEPRDSVVVMPSEPGREVEVTEDLLVRFGPRLVVDGQGAILLEDLDR